MLTFDDKTILHIGRHKSGTSAIQVLLSELSAKGVLARCGFFYPLGNTKRHHDLALQTKRKKPALTPGAKAHIMRIAAEIRAASGEGLTSIISSESFQGSDPQIVREMFPGATQVVVYLREQGDYAFSAWAEGIKKASVTHSLQEFLKSPPAGYDYARFLSKWAEAFGKERLNIGIYARRRFPGGNVVFDFLMRVSQASDVMRPAQRYVESHIVEINPPIHGALLEFKRRLNRHDWLRHVGKWDLVRALNAVAVRRPDLNQKIVPCEPRDLELFRAQFLARNAEVSHQFGVGEPGTLFASADSSIRAEAEHEHLFQPDYRLNDDEMSSVITELTTELGSGAVLRLRALAS